MVVNHTNFNADQNKHAFKEVVIIRHPRIGEYAFGFITSEVLLQVCSISLFWLARMGNFHSVALIYALELCIFSLYSKFPMFLCSATNTIV